MNSRRTLVLGLSKILKKQSYAWSLFLLILGAGLFLTQAYHYFSVRELKNQEMAIHQVVAQSLTNAVGIKIDELFLKATSSDPKNLINDPGFAPLQRAVSDQLHGIRVNKVKVYDPNGATVFSTETQDIGSSKGVFSAGLLNALSGNVQSEIVLMNEKGPLSDLVPNAHTVVSFVPVYDKKNTTKPFAVVEVQTTVSRLLDQILSRSRHLGLLLALAGMILFGGAFFILRRAEKHQRDFDPVTELNRHKVLLSELNYINKHQKGNQKFALFFIGIDKFSEVNTAFGHKFGDEVLKEAATRLKKTLPDPSGLYRLEGDTFAYLIENPNVNTTLIDGIPEKIFSVFKSPFKLSKEITLSASCGLVFLNPKDSPDVVVKKAHSALVSAKTLGQGQFIEYDSSQEKNTIAKIQLITELHKAIELKQLTVFYQAIVSSKTAELVGIEALIRWQHPEKGFIPPNHFIPLLEETGLINQAGAFALEQACKDCLGFKKKFPNLRLAVNLSPKQFSDPNLFKTIKEVLGQTKFPVGDLDLEITESSLAKDPARAAQILYKIRELGIRISIDDFGTGYSSLSTLRKFPLNTLKIDKSFIHDSVSDNDAKVISQAIAGLAKNLNLTIVAEGIETKEQIHFAQEIGVDKLQGYFFSKPLNPLQFASFLDFYNPIIPAKD